MTHVPQGLNNTFDHDVTILGNLKANVPTPTSDNNIANKKYVDDNFVNVVGDTMNENSSLTFSTSNYLASNASLIKMKDNNEGAKAWMTWYDDSDDKIAGITAHDYSHDTLTYHKHFSIETADSSGYLQTRLEVPYGTDLVNIETHGANFVIGGTNHRLGINVTPLKDIHIKSSAPTIMFENISSANTAGSIKMDTNKMFFDARNDNGDYVRTLLTLERDGTGVGIGTMTPATSAILDITSTTGALLLSRMTTAQRDALTAVNGMLIYNSTDNKFQGYENGSWTNLI